MQQPFQLTFLTSIACSILSPHPTLYFSVQESEDLKDMDKGPLEEMGAEIEESLFAVHKDVNHR